MKYRVLRTFAASGRLLRRGEVLEDPPFHRLRLLVRMGYLRPILEEREVEEAAEAAGAIDEVVPAPDPRYVCEECNQEFPSEHGLKIHLGRKHGRL